MYVAIKVAGKNVIIFCPVLIQSLSNEQSAKFLPNAIRGMEAKILIRTIMQITTIEQYIQDPVEFKHDIVLLCSYPT